MNNLRIILFRTEVAGNIGATARVMHNFGLSDLVLVAPQADPNSQEAKLRARHAESVLENARQVATLDEALAGCLASAAASARTGGICRQGIVGSPEQIALKLQELLTAGSVAMVFGPEPTGLTTAEVGRCDYLINIPTSNEAPALNLSHAVAICIYEAQRHLAAISTTATSSEPPVLDEDRERMFQHLRKALEDVHFLWDERADLLFHGLRQLIGRARPTANEVQLLHGLARQLEWVVANNYKVDDRQST